MTNPILQDLEEVMRLRDRVPSSTWTTMTGTFVHRHHVAIEQAMRDAKRYRWLRNATDCSGFWIANGKIGRLSCWNGEAADNAIDAVMAQEKDRD